MHINCVLYYYINMKYNKNTITKNDIEEAISLTKSMSAAASVLGISLGKFKKYAKLYNLYTPNQGGKNITKVKIYNDKSEVFKKNSKASWAVIKKMVKINKTLAM